MEFERVKAMEGQIELLEGRVRMLEDALFADAIVPVEWNLTGSEARVMGCLINREMATKQAIMAALYTDRNCDSAEEKIVDVFVCQVRLKLRPFGVEIKTVWGQGFQLLDRARFKRCAA